MKFIQTDTQTEIRMGASTQLIVSIIFIIVGAAISIGGLHLPNNSHGQTATAANGSTTTTSAHAGPILIGFGLVFFIVGVLTALNAKSERTLIVKGGNTTVTTRRLLGGATVSQSFPTASIKTVRLNSYISGTNTGPTNGGRQSNISLVLVDNTIVDVATKAGNGFKVNGLSLSSLIGKPPLTNEANQLSQFLGVPLESADMSSIAGMINTVRNAWENGDSQTFQERSVVALTHGAPSQITPQPPLEQQAPQPPDPPQNDDSTPPFPPAATL